MAVLAALVVLQLPGFHVIQSMQAVLNGPLRASTAHVVTQSLGCYLFLSLAVAASVAWSRALPPQQSLLGRNAPRLKRLQAALLLTSCALMPVLFSIMGTPSFAVVTLLSCLAIVAPFAMFTSPKSHAPLVLPPSTDPELAPGVDTHHASSQPAPPTTSEDDLTVSFIGDVFQTRASSHWPRRRIGLEFSLPPSSSAVLEGKKRRLKVHDPRCLILGFQDAMQQMKPPVPEGRFSFVHCGQPIDLTQPFVFRTTAPEIRFIQHPKTDTGLDDKFLFSFEHQTLPHRPVA